MAKKNAAEKATSIAERRRALRGDTAPMKAVTEIDLTKPGARKALTALFPRPETEVYVDATPDLEAAALAYVKARDEASLASARKEVAGNLLCNAIRKNLGIRGKGWKATWDMSKGNVDWSALTKDLGIADETIAKHRKPESRGLDVTEVAEEA